MTEHPGGATAERTGGNHWMEYFSCSLTVNEIFLCNWATEFVECDFRKFLIFALCPLPHNKYLIFPDVHFWGPAWQHEAIQTFFCYAAENIFISRIFFHHIRVLCQGHFVISIVSEMKSHSTSKGCRRMDRSTDVTTELISKVFGARVIFFRQLFFSKSKDTYNVMMIVTVKISTNKILHQCHSRQQYGSQSKVVSCSQVSPGLKISLLVTL